jgi:para-nitrobenzyl esterase
MSLFRTLIASIALLSASAASAQIREAQVTGGTVAGEVADGLSSYKGIPFAAPPVGELRWKAPQPVAPWDGVRQATEFGAACMQEEGMARQMGTEAPLSEDCLFIDVWTPARSGGERLPVIVWIHGGGYTGGAPSVALYDGANMARQGVVVVSVAYRLGAFGFLATPDLTAEGQPGSGNYGMLDMIAGLEWVRDNVGAFGGDPSRVTIMGHSAGSSAVSILAASPLARGLFHGVIAQSGANFAPPQDEPFAGGGHSTLAAAERGGSQWLAGLGATTLEQARALPAEAINAAQGQPGEPSWRPAVDGAVLPGDQVALWQAGRFNDVPVLVGTTSNEWGALGLGQGEGFADQVRANYGEFADRVLAAYPHGSAEEAAQSARWLANESGMEAGAYSWARLHAAHSQQPLWYYWFNNAAEGSGHGSEVGLVFGNEDRRPGREPWSEHNRAVSRQLQSYWVNFARTGDPNGEGLPAWPRFDPARPSVMALGLETKVIDVPNRARLDVIEQYLDWRRAN